MSNVNRKVLVVSWHFPPHKSSSAFNLFKRIKDTDFEYDVLYAGRHVGFANETLFGYASSKFNCYGLEALTEDARDLDTRSAYIQQVLSCFNQLVKTNHYRVMVSHSHEFVSHLAAMEIKKCNPELLWIASFGDPIAANPYNASYNFPMIEEDSRAESEVMQLADRIIVTNSYQQGITSKNQAQEVLFTKFFVLPHCFDDRMYPSRSDQYIGGFSHSDEKKVFRFLHVGMLYKFKRTSEPFLLGAQRLLAKHPELRGCFTLEFYGATDCFIQAAADYGLEDVVSFKGTVSYLKSLEVMTQADCLLLRDADFSDQGVKESPFYPGKLADYLGAKKPVLAVTMTHGCVPDMLGKLGGSSLTEDNIDGIAEAMFAAIKGELTVNIEEAEIYSHHQIAEKARQALSFPNEKKKILVAGHDLKFAQFILEEIEKREDLELLVDQWRGHNKHDEEQSRHLLDQADVIFCEWGLGNIVWYSQHKKAGQKLVTRVHAQELKTRHLNQCVHNQVDNYIFVSPYYYELMIARFGLKRDKCRMIYNMVDCELLDKPKLPGSEFNLGMIGDVPRLKRLDRAIDIFERLHAKDKRYRLYVKGKRPEQYPWMHSKEKADELLYYKSLYQRIKTNNWDDFVIFEDFGPVDKWLQKIGWILSLSDHESFHLSLAEGMASGANPIIYRWPGSNSLYPQSFIFDSIESIVEYIEKNSSSDLDFCSFSKEYALRFSKANIYPALINCLSLD